MLVAVYSKILQCRRTTPLFGIKSCRRSVWYLHPELQHCFLQTYTAKSAIPHKHSSIPHFRRKRDEPPSLGWVERSLHPNHYPSRSPN
jgi:hypothetical protein